MARIMQFANKVKHDFQTDVTWNRAADLSLKGARALPSGSVKYVLDKVPIFSWLPRYRWQWLFSDLIAGLTLGLMLIPQGLSYAKLATIPVQYGLMSSWLPGSLYAFMGTTKGKSFIPFLSCPRETSVTSRPVESTDCLFPLVVNQARWQHLANSCGIQTCRLDQRLSSAS